VKALDCHQSKQCEWVNQILSNLTSLPEVGGTVAYYFENFEPNHMQNVLENGLKDFHDNNRAPDNIIKMVRTIYLKQQRNIAKCIKSEAARKRTQRHRQLVTVYMHNG
jgi:hypothetical protein